MLYINNSLHLAQKYVRIFVRGFSRKPVSFEEQIMSADKYPSIFSRQMEAIVFIILQTFSQRDVSIAVVAVVFLSGLHTANSSWH